jgi:hypothetical protein
VLALAALLVIHVLVDRGPGWPAFAQLTLSLTTERASSSISPWTPDDRDRIAIVAQIDLLFGLLYAGLLALVAVWAARAARQSAYGRLGSDFAWLSVLVFVLDVPENFAYFALVRGNLQQPWPAVSALCIAIRTMLVLAVIAFVAHALVGARFIRQRVPPNKPLQPTRAAQPNDQREPAEAAHAADRRS